MLLAVLLQLAREHDGNAGCLDRPPAGDVGRVEGVNVLLVSILRGAEVRHELVQPRLVRVHGRVSQAHHLDNDQQLERIAGLRFLSAAL